MARKLTIVMAHPAGSALAVAALIAAGSGAMIVAHVEPVTGELARPAPEPPEDAEYARIAAHVEQVTAELARAPRAAASKRLSQTTTAAAAPAAPIPQRKPYDRDRSAEVVALLQQAGGTTPAVAPPAAGPNRAGLRPAMSPRPPSSVEPTTADRASPPPVVDPAAEPDPCVEALRRELRVRDELIAGLLARLEQLEQHVLLNQKDLDQVIAGAASPHGAAGPVPAAASSMPPPSPQVAQMERAPAESADRAQASDRAPAAPGQFEVDEDVVDRALERTLVQEGVLLLPLGQAEAEPSFTYTRREADTPTFVTQNGSFSVGEQEVRRNEFESNTTLRVGLPFDSQLEVAFPYRYVDQSTSISVNSAPVGHSDRFGSGFGDIRLGAAKTLLRENGGWWPDLVGRIFWDTDSGKTRDNGVVLGGGFNEVGGSLSAVKRQDPLAFVGSVSYQKAFENDNIEPGDELGFSVGAFLAASPETSLRFVLNQGFADEFKVDGDTIDGSDQVAGSLTIGAATVLGRNILLDISADVGLTDAAPDYAARVALPIRFNLPVY